jgi:hypothetical protein
VVLNPNDLGLGGRLTSNASQEAVDAGRKSSTDAERRFRSAGWWPSGGAAMRVALVCVLLLIAIGWTLTLLNK